MSIKFKALGLATLAALAVGAFGVVGATAETGGHFVSDAPSEETTLIGSQEGEHGVHFSIAALEGETGCDEVNYHVVAKGSTVEELIIEPELNECYTTPDGFKFNIDENGCVLVATFSSEPESIHSTGHLKCPPESKGIEITHPNCTGVIPPQVVQGTVYTTTELENRHALTLDNTAGSGASGIELNFESFGCILVFGTNQEAEMLGSVTVRGVDAQSEEPVNITVT